MGRLVDADALKAVFEEKSSEAVCGVELCKAVISRINEAPTVPQWISCSKRLPDVRQWVLCQCRAGIIDVLRLTADGSWNKNYPKIEYMSSFVVAWMSLPEPYKEEQDG